MTQAGLSLLLIAVLSLFFKDFVLAAAAAFLFVLSLIVDESTLEAASKPAFSLGIFFLMLFILMPVASEKVTLTDLLVHLKNPWFFLAVGTATVISYLGGRGVSYMQHPYILFAVVIGTLIGVLFFRGLPAGLVIAAGVISVASACFSS